MSPPDVPRPMFVGRSTYRRRRMADAAVLLPILGALLMIMPLLWVGNATEGAGGARTSGVMIYLFLVWGGLSVLSALVARYLNPDPSEHGADDAASEPPVSRPVPDPARGPTGGD
ncbi:hypothetical protein OO012_15775 [Rhodobacteraceae bacterium KMM 6894]|nr:hypothetical protein [Rhodobacteraceae bacterium KMM 6894]